MSSINLPLPVLSGLMPHHLDHLAPFAWLKKSPLWIEDRIIGEMAKRYYPDVPIIQKPFDLVEAATITDTIVLSTKAAPAELRAIAQSLGLTHLKFAFLPHGQSDKGLTDPLMRSIEHADIAYLYGRLQYERIREFGSIATIGQIEFVGNFRRKYYEAHRPFQDAITQEEIFAPLSQSYPTYLYAPTWSNNSFLKHTKSLINSIPDEINLIIKLHPLIEKIHPAHALYFQSLDQVRRNIRVIDTFPIIYPLLSKVDGYIGDESAIGYDFLNFDKPMFFLTDDDLPLYECGVKAPSVKKLIELISSPQPSLSILRTERASLAWNLTLLNS